MSDEWEGYERVAHVYRCFDSTGRLLYIGHTDGIEMRMEVHRIQSPWSYRCARVTEDPELPLREAQAAERAAIKAERPLFNRQGNPDFKGLTKVERDALYDERLTLVGQTSAPCYRGEIIGPVLAQPVVALRESA